MEQDRERDEIVHGEGAPRPTERLLGSWRRFLALAVAVCVALAVGGYGVRTWYEEQRRREVRLHASLYGSVASDERAYATLRLRNLGPRPLTVEDGRLDLVGFDQVWSGLDEPRTIRPREAVDVGYLFTMDCRRRPPEVAGAQLRVHRSGADRRWVDVVVPLDPPYVAGSLVRTHGTLCRGQPNPSVEIETLRVWGSSGDLVARVRMRLFTFDGRELPAGVRLTAVGSDHPGLQVSFGPLGDADAVAMPVVGDLRVRVGRCGPPEPGPGVLSFLRVELSSERLALDSSTLNPDLAFARALLDYVAERC